MSAGWFTATVTVLTVNVSLVRPCGMKRHTPPAGPSRTYEPSAATVVLSAICAAAGLSFVNCTNSPGAQPKPQGGVEGTDALFSVTAAVEGLPPNTAAGARVMLATSMGVAGMVAVCDEPSSAAVMSAVAEAVTADVLTVKVSLVSPCGMKRCVQVPDRAVRGRMTGNNADGE
jgi:hypothetical protein